MTDLIVRKDRALRKAKAALVTMKRYRGVDDVRADHAAMRCHGNACLVVVLNTLEAQQNDGHITLPKLWRDE